MQTFAEAGVSARTLLALGRQEIHSPNRVQLETIPALLGGRDVVIQSPTGSGKTIAFLIPLIERIKSGSSGPRGLVVAPTRELAIQVEEVFKSLDSGLRCALLYGGVGYHQQMAALKRGVDVVVGTPGRILDMTKRNLVSIARVEYLVLDEADQMLDSGFAPDVERILGMTYAPQIVLASATMPEWVSRMITRHLRDPLRVKVMSEGPSLLDHGLVHTDPGLKLRLLSQILNQHRGAIVFGRTKHGVRQLNRELQRLGHKSVELQGNMAQASRDFVMESFRNQRADVLVATNLAARGLDMSHVGLVINYELPDTAEALTHRIGRTARNGKTGRALTFVTADDSEKWAKLRRQGAATLRPVDVSALASKGDWLYLEEITRVAPSSNRKADASAQQLPNGRLPRSGRGRSRYRRLRRSRTAAEHQSDSGAFRSTVP